MTDRLREALKDARFLLTRYVSDEMGFPDDELRACLKDLHDALAEPDVCEWISVDDEPVPERHVLCYAKTGAGSFAILVLANHGREFPVGNQIEFHGSVTHWMPLPKPPVGREIEVKE